MQTPSIVSCTRNGGLENDLISVMSDLFRALRARFASCSAGRANSRSLCASSFMSYLAFQRKWGHLSAPENHFCPQPTSCHVRTIVWSVLSSTSSSSLLTTSSRTFACSRSACTVDSSSAVLLLRSCNGPGAWSGQTEATASSWMLSQALTCKTGLRASRSAFMRATVSLVLCSLLRPLSSRSLARMSSSRLFDSSFT